MSSGDTATLIVAGKSYNDALGGSVWGPAKPAGCLAARLVFPAEVVSGARHKPRAPRQSVGRISSKILAAKRLATRQLLPVATKVQNLVSPAKEKIRQLGALKKLIPGEDPSPECVLGKHVEGLDALISRSNCGHRSVKEVIGVASIAAVALHEEDGSLQLREIA